MKWVSECVDSERVMYMYAQCWVAQDAQAFLKLSFAAYIISHML